MATFTEPRRAESENSAELRVVVETDEHEQVEFEGCSQTEVEAKLHDFLAWAS
jgi:hypothetical protein